MVFFNFIQILIEHSVRKQWRHGSDSASDLSLHYLSMSHKKAGLIWVKQLFLKYHSILHFEMYIIL